MARLKQRINALLTRVSPNERVQTATFGAMLLGILAVFFGILALYPPLILVLMLLIVIGIVLGLFYMIGSMVKEDWLDR